MEVHVDRLRADETRLVGTWKVQQGRTVADEVARRIDFLAANVLKKRASSPDGWTILYQDPGDGRFWELAYPQSGLHGGGPPELHAISQEEAVERYAVRP
jgi:Immunity protein 27